MFTSVVWKENLILCKANPSVPQATPVLTQWLYPPLSYFQSALLRLWQPASEPSPHHCSSISSHCRLTHPRSVNGLLSWEPVCSATCCIHRPIASPVSLHFLSPDFSLQPYFSFHKSPPSRIAIGCHQQACHGDCLQNSSSVLWTLLRSLFPYEHFWPRWRRLLSSPSIYDFERLFSRMCGLRILALFFIISSS